MKFILRLIVNAVAIYVAVALLNGNGLLMETTGWVAFLWLALIFAGGECADQTGTDDLWGALSSF